ncbi:MAG: dockerin type I repeat-containing protein [Candidatus Pacebacteria bacterium]|nr:dockerin type I repeat-containing protein [Candidatus Paceibacterota bacterium]
MHGIGFRKITVFLFGIILMLFPVFVFAQEVDITVSAVVQSSTTTPSPYCGDTSCNGGETCATCPVDCGNCGGGGGGGGGTSYVSPETKVIFKGRAYPQAVLTLMKNGAIAATFRAENSGLFERTIQSIAAGNYNFSIFAEDTDGRRSVTIGFSVGVLADRTTTVSGIFLAPTIDLGPTQVEKGNPVDIYGQSFPASQVSIFVASNEIVKNASTSANGKWSYKLDTTPLEESGHEARAKAAFGAGEQSSFSQTMSFLVVKKGAMVCKGADLNFDGKVNLVDFSILLYYWHQKKPANICADINHDGIVDLIDFSIMMYYWTK